MDVIDDTMHEAVVRGTFPGGQLLASKDGKIFFHRAYGFADLISKGPVTGHTIYDLASLTKPLATSLAVMLLIQEGRLHLESCLSDILSEVRDTPKAGIRIQHLLNHTSGLPDYQPYFQELRILTARDRKIELRKKLCDEPLVSEIGLQTLYSDIGYMFLLWVIEKLTSMPLNRFVKKKIYDPLKIDDLFFIPRDQEAPAKQYAATENCPWRKKVIQGCFHDDNAYVMGGVAGHAGLFGTASAVHILLLELMRNYKGNKSGQVFSPDLVQLFLKKNNNTDRCLGFDVPSPAGSSCGRMFDRDATVGHLGFTGTSFWMDLNKQVIIILLTNRVHPSRKNEQIKKFRPVIHDMLMKEIQRLSPG